jgi:oligopeptidase A
MTTPELLRGHGLPRFEAIDASQVKLHIPELINELGEQLTELESILEKRLLEKNSSQLGRGHDATASSR